MAREIYTGPDTRNKGDQLNKELPRPEDFNPNVRAELRRQRVKERARKDRIKMEEQLLDILPDSCILFTEYEARTILRLSKPAFKARVGTEIDFIKLGPKNNSPLRYSLLALKKYLRRQTTRAKEELK